MSTASAHDVVESQAQKFARAIRQGDLAKIADMHTTNVRLLPPGSSMLQGRAAIRSYYQMLIDNGVKDMQFKTIDAVFFGEHMIREVGRSVVIIQSPDGTSQQRDGSYVVFWQQEDGAYKVDVDIWNN